MSRGALQDPHQGLKIDLAGMTPIVPVVEDPDHHKADETHITVVQAETGPVLPSIVKDIMQAGTTQDTFVVIKTVHLPMVESWLRMMTSMNERSLHIREIEIVRSPRCIPHDHDIYLCKRRTQMNTIDSKSRNSR